MRAYEMRPEGVRARVEESADSMKHHSLTEVEEGKRGRAHRRSRIPRFRILSNAQKDARHISGWGHPSGRGWAGSNVRSWVARESRAGQRSENPGSGGCSRRRPVST